MAQLFANNAFGKLAAELDNDDTAIVLESGNGARFPSPTGGDYFLLTLAAITDGQESAWEIVKCTARVGDTLTVTRAQESTTALSWSVGDKCELRVTAGSLASQSIAKLTYDNRATLRTVESGMAVVEGLGLFSWVAGSDEPDDDESCFATANGRWLLEAASWDLVDAWQAPDDAARDDSVEDLTKKTLTGSAVCAITSVTTSSVATFSGTVVGAAAGDMVVATPPAQIGSTAADTSRLTYYAYVSAADTVTVVLANTSAASVASISAAVQTAWPITILKS